MATLTSNGSFSSLSISGSGTKNGNITFTPPTLPDGATIISTSLTANLNISMTRGSTKVTINGNTYSSSSSLSIDLGTSLTSSLSVSAKGSSFLAKGTVSISDIVYTVEYVSKHIITASTNTGGTISESGNIEVEDGGSKTFTFTPNTGYKIADVVVDGNSVGTVSSYTFENIKEDHTISVSFEIITYTITVSANNGGTISPSGNVNVNYGDNKTFTIVLNKGYLISDVIIDGTSIGVTANYTFENVTSNHTINVIFTTIKANLTVINNTNNSNIVSYPTEYQIEYDNPVDVIVTTPHNIKAKALKNENVIKLDKLSNQVFTFEEQTITDGFGKGTMYHYGNPTIYTDENGDKMLYMDGETVLYSSITNNYTSDGLTISFDFMVTGMTDTDNRTLLHFQNEPGTGGSSFYGDINIKSYKIYPTFQSSVLNTEYVIDNDTWYNLTYCRKNNVHYIFINGELVKSYESNRTIQNPYYFSIFGSATMNSSPDSGNTGYLKNIIICDSCLHTTDFQIPSEPLKETDFSGNYSVYNCTDDSMFNIPYINNDLLKIEKQYRIFFPAIDSVFYSNDKALQLLKSDYGIKLTFKSTILAFTLSFWYEITEIISDNTKPCLIYLNNNTKNICLYIKHNDYSNTNLCFRLYDHDSGYDTKVLDIVLESNQKYFFTIEYDGLNCNLYINGEYIDNLSFNIETVIDYITIGSRRTYDVCYPGYYGNINFVEGLLSNNKNYTIYPTNYQIEDIYKHTVVMTSEDDINIELIKSLPILSINSITRNKISPISGYDTSVAEFTSDTDLTEWEARATVEGQTYGHGIGTLVDSGTTLLANETATVTIDDEELTNGDVEYRISVYGKDANGVWSDE